MYVCMYVCVYIYMQARRKDYMGLVAGDLRLITRIKQRIKVTYCCLIFIMSDMDFSSTNSISN